MTSCASRFSACGTSIIRSTGRARCGGSCGARGIRVARCTVRRLMRALGLRGAVRGRAWIDHDAAPTGGRAAARSRRSRSSRRRVRISSGSSDFTYVATWGGFVYVAFVIDVFARRIVGWRVSASLRTDFVLDALEQAIYDRGGTRPRRSCITATAARSLGSRGRRNAFAFR